jgi:hypothetical protein
MYKNISVTKKHIHSICEQLIQNQYNSIRIYGIINYDKIIKYNIFTKFKPSILVEKNIYINKIVMH